VLFRFFSPGSYPAWMPDKTTDYPHPQCLSGQVFVEKTG